MSSLVPLLALEDQGELAGSASALMGTARFVSGAVIMGGARSCLGRFAAYNDCRHRRMLNHCAAYGNRSLGSRI